MGEPSEYATANNEDSYWGPPAESQMFLRASCGVAAPLVVNGGHFVGCVLDRGHDGKHEVRIQWDGSTPVPMVPGRGEADPEPQPSDGPDYHAEHEAWERRQEAES